MSEDTNPNKPDEPAPPPGDADDGVPPPAIDYSTAGMRPPAERRVELSEPAPERSDTDEE